MYNKLFTKILDSTIWLEPDSTRLVWITFLAVMDEDGFVALSSVGNVAARARVSPEDTERAIRSLEGPDSIDPAQEHEGRRIERVPYGWMVLNAAKYRDLIRRETAKEQTRARVAKHRERRGNADVTRSNEKVTPSVAVAVAVSETPNPKVAALPLPAWLDLEVWNPYVKSRPARARKPESLKAALAKLEKFREAGHDANAIIANSLANGWQMLKEPDAKRGQVAPIRPSRVCAGCGERVFTWTGDKCDPCWRKEQGLAA